MNCVDSSPNWSNIDQNKYRINGKDHNHGIHQENKHFQIQKYMNRSLSLSSNGFGILLIFIVDCDTGICSLRRRFLFSGSFLLGVDAVEGGGDDDVAVVDVILLNIP